MPKRVKTSNGTYTRALVDSDQQEWIELSPNTKNQDPSVDGDDDDEYIAPNT